MDSSGKKIVFINQATGYITIDIINEFAKEYDDVALIAGSIRVQDIPLDGKVSWSKIAIYNRGNPGKKLFSWLIGTVQILFLLIIKYRKYEIFYITIPPSSYLLSLLLPNKYSVLIFDVYPDVLRGYNVKESGIIYRLWAGWNKKLFKRAHRVYTIGEGMARLLETYMTRENLRVIPLWTGLTQLDSVPKEDNPWLKELGLENKFIVQYSGNIGYTHNVEVLVEIAKRLHSVEEIHFLIVGRGERVTHIQSLLDKYQLSNCSLLPFQPDDVLNYSLAAADMGVVILDEKTAHVSLPSKIYNLQAVGVPIFCISTLDSELSKHVQDFNNGKCFEKDDVRGMVQFILRMKDNPGERTVLAENSRKAASFFTLQNAKKYFHEYVS